MSFSMTTITSMSLREDHSTNGKYMMTIGANIEVKGEELWTAAEDDNYDTKKNDSWLRVTYKDWTGWMARIHNGKTYCKDFKDNTPPPAPAGSVIVDIFVGDDVVFHEQYPVGAKVAIYVVP